MAIGKRAPRCTRFARSARVGGDGVRGQQGDTNMVKRRKMLIGMGALAAGSAAGVGTGAFSQATVRDRNVNVAIAEDDEGFLGLDTNYEGLSNSEYARQTEDGELELIFNSDAGQPGGGFLNAGAEGLNPDSRYYFDGVFAIEHAGEFDNYGNVASITIEENLDNPDDIRFYWQVGGAGGRDTDLTTDSMGLSAGTYGTVGVVIDTPDVMPDGAWETGSITIKATNVSED